MCTSSALQLPPPHQHLRAADLDVKLTECFQTGGTHGEVPTPRFPASTLFVTHRMLNEDGGLRIAVQGARAAGGVTQRFFDLIEL